MLAIRKDQFHYFESPCSPDIRPIKFLLFRLSLFEEIHKGHHGNVVAILDIIRNEPRHEISNNKVLETRKGSDQPAHKRSHTIAFDSPLNILWLLSYWLNIIWSLWGCTGLSESIHVQMPHCWKSLVAAQMVSAKLNLHAAPMPLTKFLFNTTYGNGEMPFEEFKITAIWALKQKYRSISETSCCYDASHQVSVQCKLVPCYHLKLTTDNP